MAGLDSKVTADSPRRGLVRGRFLKWLLGILGLVLLVVLGAGLWFWSSLQRSLPLLQGERTLAGLSAPVVVERDGLGVPTITGDDRLDVARATGFIHAQDRFFQMDLSRRRAAGELSELLGPATLGLDRSARLHRMRTLAQRVLAAAQPGERALIEAYTAGVNAGLAALRAKPFEYLLLGAEPSPWREEDCVLVLASMFFQLQDSAGARDTILGSIYDALPRALADFLTSPGSDWDTPLTGDPIPPPALPGPETLNLRARHAPASSRTETLANVNVFPNPLLPGALGIDRAWDDWPGSNNWAVSGAHTATGSAILANDMHLGIGVPNTWYRASLAWGSTGSGKFHATGVTLPGMPAIVVGSNGYLAWGFTNSQADLTDVVLIEPDPSDPSRYLAPGGPRPFERDREIIHVKGGKDEILEVQETIWGPVAAPTRGRRLRAIRWVAHDVEGMNMSFLRTETARTMEEAFDSANRAGIPAQNFVVATHDGHIGWTIAGRIPRRIGFDGRTPTSWADGTRRWEGYLAPQEYLRIADPPSGRIFTANNRTVGGEFLRVLGDGGYDLGARARQIRDDLQAIEHATPRDMLNVHLDDRALFLARWRSVALQVLTDAAIGGNPGRQQFRQLLTDSWTSRASIDSVAYRLVRSFRTKTAELASAPITAQARRTQPALPLTLGEGPLWQLVSLRPQHLLDPKYGSWDDLLLAAIDGVVKDLTEGGRRLADRSWGERNTTQIRHALSRVLPFASRWLDMPPEQLPGDNNMPRVQGPDFGASERLAVSPGRESEGYFHMPGGQSGHPLSPHYRDGFGAWAHGEPTPFLPGPTVHRLLLVPSR